MISSLLKTDSQRQAGMYDQHFAREYDTVYGTTEDQTTTDNYKENSLYHVSMSILTYLTCTNAGGFILSQMFLK